MNLSIQTLISIFVVTVSLVFSVPAIAADSQSSAPEEAAAPEKSHGILPLPDYSGDFFKRSYLLGDFGGKRSEWASKGVTFNIDSYQYLQSVTDGGAETDTKNGGVVDFNLVIDFDRMGLIPGGLLQMRAVSRYGKSVNLISGGAIPVNTNATTPTTSDPNEDVFFYLPVINYTQFLSEKFALLVGKINTYPQSNEFKGGDGKSQFWNLTLAAPVAPVLIIPYSTLAAGAIIMPTSDLTIQLAVGTSTDTSNRSGFDDLNDGMFGLFKIAYQYQLGDLPGGIVEQFGYGWDSDFTEVNGRFVLISGTLTPTTEDTTWFNSFDVWQYLWVEGDSKQKVDINNGRQDLQGVGVFCRYQFADKDTNPLDYMISFGVNAKGLFSTRDDDTMGLGYVYTKLQDLRLGNIVGIADSSTVWELFYNIELTPAIHLSLDGQLVNGALPNTDRATILGAQLEIRL